VKLYCYKTTKEESEKVKFILKINGRSNITTVAVHPGRRRPDTCISVVVPWMEEDKIERHATEKTLLGSPSMQQLEYRRHTVIFKAFLSPLLARPVTASQESH
jgi:hypothetical protein